MPWGKACLICGMLSFSLSVDSVSAAEDTGAGGDIASSAQHADPDGPAIVERQLQDADEQLIRSEPYLHLLGTYQAWSPITSGVSIQRAIALALKRDVSLAAAREQVVEADYAKKNAVWSYLPRITASTEFAQVDQSVINTDNQVFQEGDATFKTLVAQLELVQPIFDLARIRGLHIAEGERAASRAALVAESHEVVYTLVTAYLRALEKKAQLDGVEQRLKLLGEQERNEQKLENTGFATGDASDLIALEIGAAQSEQISLSSQYSMALVELSRMAGHPIDQLVPVQVSEEVHRLVDSGSVESLIRQALTDNPRVNLQRLETLGALRSFKQQRASELVPTLDGFFRGEYEDREASRFGGGSETFDNTIGLRLSIPLLNASGRGYTSREARSQYHQAVLREAKLLREIEVEVATLMPRLAAEHAVLAQADAVIEASEALVERAEKAAGTGFGTEMLVLRHSLQLELAKARAEQARYAFLSTWIRLAYLIGEPIEVMF